MYVSTLTPNLEPYERIKQILHALDSESCRLVAKLLMQYLPTLTLHTALSTKRPGEEDLLNDHQSSTQITRATKRHRYDSSQFVVPCRSSIDMDDGQLDEGEDQLDEDEDQLDEDEDRLDEDKDRLDEDEDRLDEDEDQLDEGQLDEDDHEDELDEDQLDEGQLDEGQLDEDEDRLDEDQANEVRDDEDSEDNDQLRAKLIPEFEEWHQSKTMPPSILISKRVQRLYNKLSARRNVLETQYQDRGILAIVEKELKLDDQVFAVRTYLANQKGNASQAVLQVISTLYLFEKTQEKLAYPLPSTVDKKNLGIYARGLLKIRNWAIRILCGNRKSDITRLSAKKQEPLCIEMMLQTSPDFSNLLRSMSCASEAWEKYRDAAQEKENPININPERNYNTTYREYSNSQGSRETTAIHFPMLSEPSCILSNTYVNDPNTIYEIPSGYMITSVDFSSPLDRCSNIFSNYPNTNITMHSNIHASNTTPRIYEVFNETLNTWN